MTDQERLEEVKKRRRKGYDYNPASVEVQTLDEDFNWLISTVAQLIDREQDLKNRLKEKGE